MCLITKQVLPFVAEEDIVVYKELYVDGDGFRSVHEGYVYKKGKLCRKVTLRPNDGEYPCYADTISQNFYSLINVGLNKMITQGRVSAFSRGYHSYLTVGRGLSEKWDNTVMVECIIPKGTEYVLDETGLCVSSQIIINEQLN